MDENPYQSPDAQPNEFQYASWRHGVKRGAILGAATVGIPLAVICLTVFVALSVRVWRRGDPGFFWGEFTYIGASLLLMVAATTVFCAGLGAVLVGARAAMRRKKNPD